MYGNLMILRPFQVLLNKLQLNITKFTNFRPKMAAFSLKTSFFHQGTFRDVWLWVGVVPT